MENIIIVVIIQNISSHSLIGNTIIIIITIATSIH